MNPAKVGRQCVQSNNYWSATTNVDAVPASAWDVNFDDGSVVSDDKGIGLFVWCVRGGMNTDAY